MRNILLTIWIIISLLSSAGLKQEAMADNEICHKEVADVNSGEEEKDKEEETKQYFQIDKALTGSVSLLIHAGFQFTYNFPAIEERQQKIHQNSNICQSEFYRVLFRSIISPNAP